MGKRTAARLRTVFAFAVALIAGCATVALAQDTVGGLRERILELQNKGKLGIRGLVMCRSVTTYGQYVVNEARTAPAGSTVHFYYEPENVFTQRDRTTYRIWYTQDIVLLKKDGTELFRSNGILAFTHLGFSSVLDLYATNELDLGELAQGEYRFRIVLHDKLRGAEASAEISFTITAKG